MPCNQGSVSLGCNLSHEIRRWKSESDQLRKVELADVRDPLGRLGVTHVRMMLMVERQVIASVGHVLHMSSSAPRMAAKFQRATPEQDVGFNDSRVDAEERARAWQAS